MNSNIENFLAGAPHAVVGASRDRTKYGNRVLRCYQQASRPVFAVNPNNPQVEGLPCYADIASLPVPVHGISIITPPDVTERIAAQAVAAGIKHVWMQPGAESEAAIATLQSAGISVIFGGPCILVVLGFRDR